MSASAESPSVGFDFIGGRRVAIAGSAIEARDPADPARVHWTGTPVAAHVDDAVAAARHAFEAWGRATPESRAAVLRRYQRVCQARAGEMASLIREQTGKAQWDAAAEAGLLAGKVEITLDPAGAMARVRGFERIISPSRIGRCWFRPHGVMAVVGPFNFPAHLPNGHIVPALAMGNTIVLKPSEKAPGVAELLAEMFLEAARAEGAPEGIVNLVHGGGDIASRLVAHAGIDGVLFTGSFPVGRAILAANLDRPGRIIALEMGGNNAAIVMPDADLKQAVLECARSAFVTAGQRCTCTRRLILHRAVAGAFLESLRRVMRGLVIGDPRGEVFMGPMISGAARDAVLEFQRSSGAEVLEPCRPGLSGGSAPGHYITPGLLRIERFTGGRDDTEVFGPLLRVAIADDLDDAIAQANATRFGLAASIFTRDAGAIERFLAEARVGCANVNTGTAGASSLLPFGGLGLSGNHRPAGAFSLDYCAYPVAGLIESGSGAAATSGMSVTE